MKPIDVNDDTLIADRMQKELKPRWTPQLYHILVVAVLFSMLVIIVFQLRDIKLANERTMMKDVATAEQLANVVTRRSWLSGRGPAGQDFLITLDRRSRIALVDLQHDGRTFVEMSYGDRCGSSERPAVLLMRRDPSSDIDAAVIKPTKIAPTPWLEAALRVACALDADQTKGVVRLTLGQAISAMSDRIATSRLVAPEGRGSVVSRRNAVPSGKKAS